MGASATMIFTMLNLNNYSPAPLKEIIIRITVMDNFNTVGTPVCYANSYDRNISIS